MKFFFGHGALRAALRMATACCVAVLLSSGSQAAIPLLDGRNLPTLAPLISEVTPAVVNIATVSR